MRKRLGKSEAQSMKSLGGEACESFSKSDLDGRLGRYSTAKEKTLQFSDYLYNHGEVELSDSLSNCGTYMVLRDYFTIGQSRISKICTCKKHLICQLCAIRRGAKAVRVYLDRFKHLMGENSSLIPYMVTFTVKNGPCLSERLAHLMDCLRSYHRRRSRSRQSGEVLKASAAVWSYEVTNKGNGWHPHCHAVWLCTSPPDPVLLSREWHALTGDSFIVDVTRIDEKEPVNGFLEVFKYALKFGDLNDENRLHAYREMKGKRLQASFGGFRGLDIEPSDSDELIDDLPYIERLFHYIPGRGYRHQVFGSYPKVFA